MTGITTIPSPEQIKQASALIRSTWNERERQRRRQISLLRQYELLNRLYDARGAAEPA